MSVVEVTLTGVTKRFGSTVAVQDLTMTAAAGSFTALLGPSGCGKSTTLAVIAGLQEPDAGDVRFDGVSVLAVAAERRGTGLVFQKPLLFPHLSVAQNVGFGLRMRRLDKGRARQRVSAMLDRVQLGDLADRRVGQLSGGQEQRVALARALVLQPKVLLLDEPFSQLDAGLRHEMRGLVRHLHDEGDLTTIFVTHDHAEAVEVADTVALLLQGRLAAAGSPEMFYRRPPSLAAARFFGATNQIAGMVSRGIFTADGAPVRVSTTAPSGPAVLVVRPEAIRLHGADGSGLAARVLAARFAGTHLEVDLLVQPDQPLVVFAPIEDRVQVGSTVEVGICDGSGNVFSARQP